MQNNHTLPALRGHTGDEAQWGCREGETRAQTALLCVHNTRHQVLSACDVQCCFGELGKCHAHAHVRSQHLGYVECAQPQLAQAAMAIPLLT
jgi:hypothetical protein